MFVVALALILTLSYRFFFRVGKVHAVTACLNGDNCPGEGGGTGTGTGGTAGGTAGTGTGTGGTAGTGTGTGGTAGGTAGTGTGTGGTAGGTAGTGTGGTAGATAGTSSVTCTLVGCDEDACPQGKSAKECDYQCSDGTKTGRMESCGGGGGGGGGGGNGGGSSPTATPAPTCAPYTLKSGIVSPNYVLPGADVLVTCGYGFDSDCIKVTGGGLTNCSVRTYVNGETVFGCHAGANPGAYNDVKCVTTASSTGNHCCVAQQDTLPAYTVMSTAAHFEQRMRIPAGVYVLSVRYNTIIWKEPDGAYADLLCASADCGGGKKLNETLGRIALTQNGGFDTKSLTIPIPADGNNKDYKVRIVVGGGSEAYIDKVSFNGGGIEYVLNGDFKNIRTDLNAVALDQAVGWGQANNKIGFYYGMAINTNFTNPATTVPASSVGGSNISGAISTPGATSMKLNMKLKLQGVSGKPKNTSTITVKVKLGGALLQQSTAYQNVTFTAGDNGIWTGSTELSLPPGPGYMLYVKGPKHLQKKVCASTPIEGSGGSYHCSSGAITLQAGDNTVDMSKILQLVGDLPENGAQNGIVDSYDTSYVRQHLQSTKTEDLAIGDLNYDGVIDAQDYSLVIASLSIKYDEE